MARQHHRFFETGLADFFAAFLVALLAGPFAAFRALVAFGRAWRG
jgi:hypothetical protein